MSRNTIASPELLAKIRDWKVDLIRRGWSDGYESPPPPDAVIEYHAVWLKHRIFSGRCRLNDYDKSDNDRIGSHRYLMMRWDKGEVLERVWRISNKRE